MTEHHDPDSARFIPGEPELADPDPEILGVHVPVGLDDLVTSPGSEAAAQRSGALAKELARRGFRWS